MGADTWPTTSEVPGHPGWRFANVERRWDGTTLAHRTFVTVTNTADPANKTVTGQADSHLTDDEVVAMAQLLVQGLA